MRNFSTLAITLAISMLALTGCKEEKQPATADNSAKASGESTVGAARLLERINHGDDLSTKYEYDDKNRIVRLIKTQGGNTEDITTLTYNGDNLVTVAGTESNGVRKFERKGNIITVKNGESVDTLTLNKDGFITEIMPQDALSSEGYSWAEGNLTEKGSESGSYKYKYDDKKSPYQCNTPKWVIQYLFSHTDASKNNVIEENYRNHFESGENFQHSYKYQYDSDGFPTDKSWSSPAGDEWWNGFVYRKK